MTIYDIQGCITRVFRNLNLELLHLIIEIVY